MKIYQSKWPSSLYAVRLLCFLFSTIPGLSPARAQSGEDISKPVQFRQKAVAMESYESVGVFDVDGDDTLDLVSGAFWYEGPDFEARHFIIEVDRFANGEYYNDFANIPFDINGDGAMDYVTGSWGKRDMRWRENPGNDEPWREYVIDTTGPVECLRAWDVDGDGHREIVPNNPGHALKIYQVDRDGQGKPTGTFARTEVAAQQGHGLGFGDINGDGRGDLISADHWFEAPADPFTGTWKTHQELSLGAASVPILVEDVNGDGKNDLIVGQGHGYGLSWYEQSTDQAGQRSWIAHSIDPFNAQFHTMEWVDVTGDEQPELVTGKRYRAHNGRDPGSADPLGLYYFQWNASRSPSIPLRTVRWEWEGDRSVLCRRRFTRYGSQRYYCGR